MKIKTPAQESERLEALKEYNILDTPSEQAYDDITRLAAFICNVPIALITFVDTDRQWFKSKVGLDVDQTSRDVSFCSQCILKPEMMVIKDTFLDEHFKNNPLVNLDPYIRFYAGVPLLSPSNQPLGTLCIIDREPRELSELQKNALESLARQVMMQLELRRVSSQLAAALDRIKIMEGLIPICSYCKGIRNDQGYWSTVEKFIEQHSDVEFTHGICNDCMKIYFPDVADILLKEENDS